MKSLISHEQSELIQNYAAEIPEFSDELGFFFDSFNHVVASRDGVVEMSPGSFIELDDAKANAMEWERKFENYINEQEIRLKYSCLYVYNNLNLLLLDLSR